MSKFRQLRLGAMFCAAEVGAPAMAQVMPDGTLRATERHGCQEQEADAQRARAAEGPDVLSSRTAESTRGIGRSTETPSFLLRALQEYLIGLLIDNGQVTARVVVPEQSLAGGTPMLRYAPVRISAGSPCLTSMPATTCRPADR
ncbi:hypothetical protein RAS12_08930 [Achromobacter seleniivolatilans]|uniref:Uncharacterized protein n=1 Tax=Achromobacter seleniivolatilans TaxID=3047478 RepID=A0ABY9M709_9BURK|nr:hypothetical protein [Achromobacter sp. R39]WMD22485.1 hypothetical protein RAS12_08930 [Achromobacter sp. R39]